MDEQALDKNKQQLGTYRVILEPEGRASVNSQLSKKLVPFSDEWSAPPCRPPPQGTSGQSETQPITVFSPAGSGTSLAGLARLVLFCALFQSIQISLRKKPN